MSLERERTHSIWQELEDGAGSLHLLLTISGTTASETISDLTTYEEIPRERQIIHDRYVSAINKFRDHWNKKFVITENSFLITWILELYQY